MASTNSNQDRPELNRTSQHRRIGKWLSAPAGQLLSGKDAGNTIAIQGHVQHLDDGSSLTSYRKDVATILPSEFPTSISPCADGSINQDSWDSSNTVRAYTTIYYDIVKDSGDRSYYKLTKVTGKYYCNNSATKITSQTLRIGQTGWTSNGYREQTKDFDIPASQKDWTKYPDSSWAGVLVDATNRVGCYYVVNIAAKTGKTWYVEISNNIR